jgi:hypothetical protein
MQGAGCEENIMWILRLSTFASRGVGGGPAIAIGNKKSKYHQVDLNTNSSTTLKSDATSSLYFST